MDTDQPSTHGARAARNVGAATLAIAAVPGLALAAALAGSTYFADDNDPIWLPLHTYLAIPTAALATIGAIVVGKAITMYRKARAALAAFEDAGPPVPDPEPVTPAADPEPTPVFTTPRPRPQRPIVPDFVPAGPVQPNQDPPAPRPVPAPAANPDEPAAPDVPARNRVTGQNRRTVTRRTPTEPTTNRFWPAGRKVRTDADA